MRRSQLAAKRCRQVDNFELNTKISGTAVTPAASGLDASTVASVEKLGTGNYKINFKDKSHQEINVTSLVPFTAARIGRPTATDQGSVTVQFTNLSGVAAECDFALSVNWLGTKHLF